MSTAASTPTVHDFCDGRGPVPAHRHPNGGGWVANTALVDRSAYVGPDAKVYTEARVFENARVEDCARVHGYALVAGRAQVRGRAWVGEYARVDDDALVRADAGISDHAEIVGHASVSRYESLAFGRSLDHYWTTYHDRNLGRVLRFGCEMRPVGEWRERLRELCEEHEPDNADEYERVISALLDLCDALPDEEAS